MTMTIGRPVVNHNRFDRGANMTDHNDAILFNCEKLWACPLGRTVAQRVAARAREL